MRKVLGLLLVLGLLALPVAASDEPVLMLNTTGQPAPEMALGSFPEPVDPPSVICGDLAFDGVNGLAAQRRDDIGLESWVMVNCQITEPTEIQGFIWVTVDNGDNDWIGVDDFAIWDAATVEQGCADDSNSKQVRNLTNTREGPLGVLFGRNIWRYTLKLPDDGTRPILQPGKYYFGVRAVLGTGQSFILTVPCNGRKPIYFQSAFFGFPCAVPGINVFGADFCAAVQVLGKPVETQSCCTGAETVKALCKRLADGRCKVLGKVSGGRPGCGVQVCIQGPAEGCKVTRFNDRGKAKGVFKGVPCGTYRVIVIIDCNGDGIFGNDADITIVKTITC